MALSAPICVICGLLLFGCASTPEEPSARHYRKAKLALALKAINPNASEANARILARVAVETAAQLRQQYHMQFNHNLHNLLVYWGIKDRGFCWHWQLDLGSAIGSPAYPGFEVRRIWAYPGSMMHEHHALVVTKPGQPWQNGLVLDAWRDEGVLWFGPVKTDKYPWQAE